MAPAARLSALESAAGSGAELLEQLGWVLYIGSFLIFGGVMVLALYATFAKPRHINGDRWIVGGGLIFPAVTLTGLLLYSLAIGNGLGGVERTNVFRLFLDCFGIGDREPLPDMDRIHVVGKQWWWEVRYEFRDGRESVVLANELRIPTGRPVEIWLSSDDVIHSFWAPSLAGKVDMIPGQTNRLVVRTDEAAIYRGQCAEYCGGQHAIMAFFIIAAPEQEFNEWVAREAAPAAIPGDEFLRSGYDAFFRGGCAECHTIRGTPASGDMGPDLTHVGSRVSLGAGALSNHIGTMAGWIAGSQDIKPGNLMPSLPIYTGAELRAVSAWLKSLE